MSETLSCTPQDITETSVSSLIPDKSRHLYEKQYSKFQDWCSEKNVKNISENVLLGYFELQRKQYKYSTLVTIYSMIRCCLNLYKNVDISKFNKLQALLKRASTGFVPKKPKNLELDDVNKFINLADDRIYLAIKVILIIGYNGACRREELINMSTSDFEYISDCIIVSIHKTKKNVPRKFAISDTNWVRLIKDYADLRPSKVTHKRFFLTYRNGYCINSPIGINYFGKVWKIIASYLKLPNPELFSCPCLRKSSATHFVNFQENVIHLSGYPRKSTAISSTTSANEHNIIDQTV